MCLIVEKSQQLEYRGHKMEYLDIGGGLGIDYYHGSDPSQPAISSKTDLIANISAALPHDVKIILEPGRSIVANTGEFPIHNTTSIVIIPFSFNIPGVLVSRVLGTKRRSDDSREFAVVDAAMNDLIRPSFYQAYHHILPVFQQTVTVN